MKPCWKCGSASAGGRSRTAVRSAAATAPPQGRGGRGLRPLALLLAVVVAAAADTPGEGWWARPPISPHWGNLERAYVIGGPFDDNACQLPGCALMEPFVTRDGKWLLFNSQNVGNDTSLHYARCINHTHFQYAGRLQPPANAPVPHLDAVPSMAASPADGGTGNRLYWITNRDYPTDVHNVMTGLLDFANGSVSAASHVGGTIYITPRPPLATWIVMDQEVSQDGSMLFYCNARFVVPNNNGPSFCNISLADVGGVGEGEGDVDAGPPSAVVHPNGTAILAEVNGYRTATRTVAQTLKWSPSTYGADGLELMFAALVDDTVPNPVVPGGAPLPLVSGLFVVNRTSRAAAFGPPTQLSIPVQGRSDDPANYQWYMSAEAPTYAPDGNRVYFTRLDCLFEQQQQQQQQQHQQQEQQDQEQAEEGQKKTKNKKNKGHRQGEVQEAAARVGGLTPKCFYHLWTMQRL